MNEWVIEWMNEWVNEWMNETVWNIHSFFYSFILSYSLLKLRTKIKDFDIMEYNIEQPWRRMEINGDKWRWNQKTNENEWKRWIIHESDQARRTGNIRDKIWITS
jgi:hypothetical protein